MTQITLARWACVLFLSFGLAACEAPDPLSQIIEKNTAARGGAEAIASVQTIQVRIQITEPSFQVMGHYAATRDGKMRIDIFADGQRVFTEAFNGESGWQMFGDGTVADMSEAGEAAVRHGIITNLYGLNEMAGINQALEYIGREMIDGRDYEKFDLIFDDGFVLHYDLDSETGLIVRQYDEVALHPDLDDTVQRFMTVYSDFRTVGGVVYSFHDEKRDLDTDELVQTTQIEEIVQNPEIDPAFFERPDG
ncbi:MAG: hypothetical protein IH995_00920 [Proteobacteria bacterium]|nr:hypothetical protein [Pseudomonadota bacterium]